ncbi:hypothetical protein F0562_027231 [Nyssa sinensis]|uniref:non-specific serine/threonine protein kinase n=1 Tax=Nyssa sinensis TaxID=561372 RepID=A0A5J5B2Z1_9ASTE|nr:hypothetical protein F0562_027231 [Nyssa sinensis]
MEAHQVQLRVALIFLLVNSVLTQQVRLSSDSEWSALLDLRSSLGLRARDWPRKADPCSAWTGITCQNGRVVGITLSGLRRTYLGSRNPRFTVDSLANFTLLASFNSSGFLLKGSIPEWFGRSLSALQLLDLRSCSITGTIPPSLGNLSLLNSLYLSDNLITGIIPPTLGQLPSLSVLNLSQNLFKGSIPPSLSALRNLTNLDLSSNFLSGPIPSGFGSLSSLQFLNLYNNSLTGSIPVQLANLSQLIELDLGFNSLSGSVPEELGRLGSLQKMLIGNNSLEGRLPRSLFLNVTRLQYVVLSWNRFDGNLPDVLWSIPQLNFLDVSGNNLTGVLSNLIASFNATRAMFNLSNNLFYGNLTSTVGKFSSIDLSSNYFEGSVPNNVGTNVVIARNCLRSMLNQRSLEDCEVFYAERGLTFYNDRSLDPTQLPLPEPASNNKKRLTYIMALGESFTFEKILQATDNFSDTNLIKHGHSGDLFRGTLESGFPVVIKRVDLSSFREETYMSELDIFRKTSHPRDIQASSILLDDKYDVRIGSLSEVHVQGGDNHQNVITRLLRMPQ